MYQSLEPEPEGAICPQRSLPQATHSSPHDTDTSIAYWLKTNIQGIAASDRSPVSSTIDRRFVGMSALVRDAVRARTLCPR
jgi:hypothetical protein